jgi:hypothetical protein
MRGFLFRLFSAGAVLAASLASTACGGGGTEPDETQQIAVTLASHDGAISIIGPGETYPCAVDCELQNGGSRSIYLQAKDGQIFVFKAYFGGNLRDTRGCKWRGETVIQVDWQNGELNCINWSPA